MSSNPIGPVQPWWRIRMVWLAFGGPAFVVAACVVTIFFAMDGRDRPIADAGAAESDANMPAQRARNHVATPRR